VLKDRKTEYILEGTIRKTNRRIQIAFDYIQSPALRHLHARSVPLKPELLISAQFNGFAQKLIFLPGIRTTIQTLTAVPQTTDNLGMC
jgi:hypothetical protein